ncbi:MAG: DUF5723 family protein, partial [Treponema sp.]|nr:DUF5723 family protein [Treponema sp.]
MKKFILLLVFLAAVLCLYAQDSGDEAEVYDFDALYADPGNPPLIIGDSGGTVEETAEEEPLSFFGTTLSYLDNPKVTTRHLDRKRIFELKLLDVEAKFGNNLIGLGDIFKKQIVIDLDKFNSRIDNSGASLNLGFDLNSLHISVNPTERWGGSFGVGTSGRFDLTIPKELLNLIAEGNEGHQTSSGEFIISGSIFYEIGVNVHGTLPILNDKLTIGVDSAYYSPLLYIPRSSLSYTLDTNDKIQLSSGGSFKAYTTLDTGAINAGDFFKSGGVDLSLSAEYALFNRLDLGLAISHIPLVPANLSTGYEFAMSNTKIIDIVDINIIDLDNVINTPEFTGNEDFVSLPAIVVFRPLRFDFYNIYRPFN